MAVINLTKRGSDTGDWIPLPTDIYYAKIVECELEVNPFDKNKDGSDREQIKVVWETTRMTVEQTEAGIVPGDRVYQRFNPYYGNVKDGGVSKFKAFIDSLRSQGYLPNFSMDSFDTQHLVGLEQRISVECYTKGMGINAGKQGNRVTAIAPLTRAPRNAPPIPKNQPQPEQVAPPTQETEINFGVVSDIRTVALNGVQWFEFALSEPNETRNLYLMAHNQANRAALVREAALGGADSSYMTGIEWNDHDGVRIAVAITPF